MTIGDIQTKARNLVNADATSFSAADILIDINMWYQKISTMILDSQDGSDFDDYNNSDYPELTFPLVGSQRDYTIPISEKMLKIKRLDVTYDGTNWYKAEPFDSGETGIGFGNDTTVDGHFSKTEPFYDVRARSMWIYPLASASDVTAGAKGRVQWSRQVTEFTSGDLTTGTKVPGFDDPFHPMLAYGAAFEYAIRHGLENMGDLLAILSDYENRLKNHYSFVQQDRKLTFKSADVNYE